MKKTLLLFGALLFITSQSFAQVYLYEPFNYSPTGTSLLDGTRTNPTTQTTWKARQTNNTKMIVTDSEHPWGFGIFSLGLPATTGTSLAYKGATEDSVLDLKDPLDASVGPTVYLSFLVDVLGWNSSASVPEKPEAYRQIHFGIPNGTGGYNAASGLFIGPGLTNPTTTFRLGYGNSDETSTVVWGATDYPFTDLGGSGTTYENQFFIVIKYTWATKLGEMWINPTSSNTEPTPNITQTATSKVRSEFTALNFEGSSGDRTPSVVFDEVRVTGTWAEAVGGTLSVAKNEIEGLKVYPNPAKDYITIESKNTKLTSVELYNVLGAKVLSSKSLTNDRLNVSGISKGIYMLKVNAEDASSTRKIVID